MGLSLMKLASNVWRNYVTDGVPGSGVHNPAKADIRTWGAEMEAAAGKAPLWLSNIGGTGNAITADSDLGLASYATGQTIEFVPGAANTGAVTIDVDGLGTKAIVDPGGNALTGGELNSTDLVVAVYDGTSFRLKQWPVLTGTATYDPASLSDGAGATTTVTVTGVQDGDAIDVLFSNPLQGILLTGWKSASNTVSVRFQNESGGTVDLASGTITVRARRR